MLRNYDLREIQLRQHELHRQAEQHRIVARVNRRAESSRSDRSASRLRLVWAR